jgi:hypothetical protein
VARPSYRVFADIYRAAGFPPPRIAMRAPDPRTPDRDPRTPPNNVNGGTYILPVRVFEKVAHVWPKWADWLIERWGLLEGAERNIDQVSFCLALEELGVDVTELPKYFDYGVNIVNLPVRAGDSMELIGAVHYHNNLSSLGMIVPGPKCHPSIRRKIEEINELVARNARKCPAFARAAAQADPVSGRTGRG